VTFDPKPYAEGIKRANEAEEQAIRERAALARVEAKRLATKILAGDGEVRAIYLFGSLAQGEPRRLDFDIDLAMEGGDLYRALDVVDVSSFKVDLVDLTFVSEAFAARIRETGFRLS
jgi:predicted nucleotidyltransferase